MKQAPITSDSYTHVQNDNNTMSARGFEGCCIMYVAVEVRRLVDVFENFRATCNQYYKFYPAICGVLPGMAWDAMMLMRGRIRSTRRCRDDL